jgi:hypothetical protein
VSNLYVTSTFAFAAVHVSPAKPLFQEARCVICEVSCRRCVLDFLPSALNSGFQSHSCSWLKTNELCSGANALKAHSWVTDMTLKQLRVVVQHIIYRAVLLACTNPIPAGIKQELISAASLQLCCTYLFPILFART